MQKKVRNFLIIFFSVTLTVGICGVIFSLIDSRMAKQSYEKAEEIAELLPPKKLTQHNESSIKTESDEESEAEVENETEAADKIEEKQETETETETAEVPNPLLTDPYAISIADVNLSDLRDKNEHIIGWIWIPDTTVSYPILQWTDNSHYLHYTWEELWSWAGSIFMDCLTSPDFSDFNTIIFGHNMLDDTMFSSLPQYADKAYSEEHPYVYILSTDEVLRYEVYATYETETDKITYGIGEFTEEQKQKFIDFSLKSSELGTDIVPTTEDNILTLSTCTNLGHKTIRRVVQCRLSDVIPISKMAD